MEEINLIIARLRALEEKTLGADYETIKARVDRVKEEIKNRVSSGADVSLEQLYDPELQRCIAYLHRIQSLMPTPKEPTTYEPPAT